MGRLSISSVRSAKPGRHGDGEGLYLLVKPTGAKSWLLRVQFDGKRRDVGLGAADTSVRPLGTPNPNEEIPLLLRRQLTLADARDKARHLRIVAKAGRDPVTERDRDRTPIPTFEAAAKAAHLALKDGWAVKNGDAFLSSLQEHAFPKLGKLRVDHIESSDIRDMLEPIWLKIPVMARKVRQRVTTVLNFAKSKGWRPTEGPSRSVTVGLARQPKGGNFDAMPYSEVPAFVGELQSATPTTGRSALLFLILTAARPGEVRAARWKHFDLDKRDWNRPADVMKGKEAHTVTLSLAAVALLSGLKGGSTPDPEALVFAGKAKKPLSDMTLKKVLTDAKRKVDPHGFRSSFRDWAAEKMPEIPDAVAEAALAHVVPDSVIRAYKRTKFIEMRRGLLAAWSTYVCAPAADDRLER